MKYLNPLDYPHKEFFEARGYEAEILDPGFLGWILYPKPRKDNGPFVVITASDINDSSAVQCDKNGLPTDSFLIGLYSGMCLERAITVHVAEELDFQFLHNVLDLVEKSIDMKV